ncbi:MAG TPA: LysM domain-containing protein [candidate division Zixibacteria bacterium]|nr:LysM domain-containing protein [candidate division Zixibacteria bacterium]
MFFLSVLCSLFVASSVAAANQTWTVRPGDNLEIVSMTLQIPQEEIRRHNPGISETGLQIGQRLKLPLRSYPESAGLERDLDEKASRIADLESRQSDLENRLAGAQSRLRWHPVWFWGFWICFGVIAFITAGSFWIFRQTHPKVLEKPRERTIEDLKASQTRLRSSFSFDAR